MFSSVEQAFMGREEIRAALKTPAWEATSHHAIQSLQVVSTQVDSVDV